MADEKERQDGAETELCKSVFRSGEDVALREAYTKKWVAVICALEGKRRGA